MAAPISQLTFNVLDSPLLDQTQFGPDMKNWLSNTVDILNSELITIDGIFSNILTISTINAGGTFPVAFVVPVLGLTSSGFVITRLISTTIPGVTITNVVVGTDQFTVTFSADPGASAIIAYQAFSQNPQG